jgi:hypothetical protein
VTLVDDHDQVRKWTAKRRFCGDSRYRDLAFNVMAAQLTPRASPASTTGANRLRQRRACQRLRRRPRENMFGGQFGGLCTQAGTSSTSKRPVPRPRVADRAAQELLTLRRGSQVLHRVSGDGVNFGHPQPHRAASECGRSCAGRGSSLIRKRSSCFNTDESNAVALWSTVAPMLRVEGDRFHLIFWHAPKAGGATATTLTVEERAGLPTVAKSSCRPPGFAIYHASPSLHRLGPHPTADLKPWHQDAWHG